MPVRLLDTFGRLPRTWLNLLLILASGLAEGLGITMFIPLLQVLMGVSDVPADGRFYEFQAVIDRFGIPVNLTTMLVAIGVLSFLSLCLGYAQRKMLARSKHLYVWQLRDRLMSRILTSSWEYGARQSHGAVINDLVIECGRAGNALGYELMAVATGVQVVVYIAFSGLISWHLMLVTIGFSAFVVLVVRPLLREARVLGEASNRANRDITADNVDYLRGLKLIKAMGGEELSFAMMARRNRELFDVTYHSEVNSTQVYYLVQALPVVLLLIVIALGYGVFALPAAAILIFLVFLARVAPRVAQFQQMHQSYLSTAPAETVVRVAIDAAELSQENGQPDGIRCDGLKHGIAIEGVTYRFPDGETPVLNDISLTIGRNRMIAIVGASGAGKSTLVDLLIGLRRPGSGKVMIDGTDLNAMNLASWRSRIGFVTQDNVTFNDTLRANLTFLRPHATSSDIDAAIRIAQLEKVVEDLPNGLDTPLGENGVRLSGGQRQRVALARAVVGHPDLLILDEATSALDNESERAVQAALEGLAHQLAIVVIAHRLSTVRKADVIYVLDEGRVVESGDYDSLLARRGRFAELHDSQFN